MSAEFRADYDSGEDLLFLYDPQKKSKGSVEFGDLVLDLEKNGKIVGLEIFAASGYFSELAGKKITKKDLGKIQTLSCKMSEKKGSVLIRMEFSIKNEKIPATIAVPSLRYTSPILAKAR